MTWTLHRCVIAAAVLIAGCGEAEQASTAQDQKPIEQVSTNAQEAADTPPLTPKDAPTIVFLGDSLTAGFGLPPENALPEQVASRLEAAGVAAEIINAGVSGDTTANGLARYDWSVASAAPDLLIVALGANDYLMGTSPDAARDNLAKIIERAQADGLRLALAGLEPRSNAPEGTRDAAYAAIYPDLAQAYGVPLYPALLKGVRDNPDLLQSDGLHPTADGVEVMAANITAFLQPLIP